MDVFREGNRASFASVGAVMERGGDIDGLVHISQISEDRVDKIKDHLKIGQDIEARVIKVDKTERLIGSTSSPRAASRSRRRTTTRKS